MPCFDHSNNTQQTNTIIQHQKGLTEMVQPYLATTTVQEHQKAVLPDMVQAYPANANALEDGEIPQMSESTIVNLQENSNTVKKRYCCKECNKKDCGKCNTCLQKPKFGGLPGKGRNNKRCLVKAKNCLKLPENAKNEDLQEKKCYCKGCSQKACGTCYVCKGGIFGGINKLKCLAQNCLITGLIIPKSAKNENLQQNSKMDTSNTVNSNMIDSNMVNSNMVNTNMVDTNMVMFPKSCKCEGCNRADCGNCNVCYNNHNITIGNSSGNIMRCLAKTCLD